MLVGGRQNRLLPALVGRRRERGKERKSGSQYYRFIGGRKEEREQQQGCSDVMRSL